MRLKKVSNNFRMKIHNPEMSKIALTSSALTRKKLLIKRQSRNFSFLMARMVHARISRTNPAITSIEEKP